MSESNLWAPWRMQYIQDLGPDEEPAKGCFLCDYWGDPENDADHLVIYRNSLGMILLNRYPYANGHLMVCPGGHVADLTELSAGDRARLMEMTALAERTLQLAFDPQGVNIGLNIGRCAGAGLPGHMHVHLVPRWSGDTNFITVVGRVRVIPQALEETHKELAKAIEHAREAIDPDGGD